MKTPTAASDLPRGQLDLLIRRLRERKSAEPRVAEIPRRTPGSGPARLSPDQERLWFLHRVDPASPAYNLGAVLRLRGTLDRVALVRALGDLAERHESLRTRVVVDEQGEPLQGGVAACRVARLPCCDLTRLPRSAARAEARRLARAHVRRPFDLARGPLVRMALVESGADGEPQAQAHDLLLSVHHLVGDGWSVGIFFEELRALYEARLAGARADLPELPVGFGDFAAWQRERVASSAYEASLAYWRERLTGAPAAELPADRPRPRSPSSRGERLPVVLERDLANRLRRLAAAEGATLYAALLAGFQLLLRRFTGEDDVVTGAVVAGRTRPEIERLIGFFANTLALRTDTAGARSFRALLRRSAATVVEALRHQEVPFAQVVESLPAGASAGDTALFRTMISMDARPGGRVKLGALAGDVEEVPTGTAKFDLALHLVERDGEVAGSLELSLDLFDRSTAVRLWQHYVRILAAAVAAPDTRPEHLEGWSPAERQAVLFDWGHGPVPAPRVEGRSFPELVRERARLQPDAVAVEQGDERLTYAGLLSRVDRVARALARTGIGPEDRVAVLLDEPFGWPEAFLGVQAAGGAYLPLDPSQPAARLSALVSEACPRALLVRGPVPPLPELAGVPVLDLDAVRAGERTQAAAGGVAEGDGLAYVLYTSGSTGRPKGVAVSHRGLANLAAAQAARLGLSPSDRVFQFAPLVFDASVSELAASLVAGSTLVLATRDERLPGEKLAQRLRERRVTCLKLPPSSLALLPAGSPAAEPGAGLPDLRRLAVAGEPCPPVLVERWGRGRRMFNVYGPTECTVTAAAGELAAGEPVTLGGPIAGLRARVVDRDLLPLPTGVPGDLAVAGTGIARGYLARPAATAERFVPDPWSPEPGGRLYRTGDRVRWTADGRLQYLGRLDRQVKVRGVRIEPGEVEAVLGRLPGVLEAVVDAVRDAAGDMRLVAWVTPRDGAGLDGPDLRRRIGELLPPYLVPTVVRVIEEVPRTPSGKVDRRRLRTLLLLPTAAGRASAAPETPAEERLAELFGELLGLESVGRGDDFFELGGHSLTSVRLAARIRNVFGVSLPLQRVFELRTVAALAAELPDPPEPAHPPSQIEPPSRRDPGRAAGPFPLSHAQERLWLLAELDPGAATYNVAGAVRLRGRLRPAALAAGLTEIARRHQVLRATFVDTEEGPVQRVGPAAPVPLPVIDLGGVASRADGEEERWSLCMARRPLDLARGPLLEAVLLRRGPEENLLLLTMHHVVSDGWSLGILVRELREIYGARLRGVPPDLPDLALQYPELAAIERAELTEPRMEELLGYWRGRLAAAPVLELPLDRPRPPVWSGRGAEMPLALDPGPSRAVRELADREGATPFMVLAAAFQVLLGRLTGQSDVVVGFPVANRERPEAERLIGFFVNTLALRTDLEGAPRFRGLLRQVRSSVLAALDHQALPFQRLVNELAPDRDPARPPLVQALFSLQNAAEVDMALPEVEGELVPAATGTAKFELTIDLAERGDRLAGIVEYATDLFDRTTVVRLAERYRRLLAAVTEQPDVRLAEISLWTPAERHQVLVEWADGGSLPPVLPATLHEGFVARARRSPDAVAVEARWQTWSYGELDRRSAALAAHLCALGVGPEARVGVCLERTPRLLVALLGVLRAGAAYVPLDPAYPQERIAFMLGDAACRALVTDGSLADRLPPGGAGPPVVVLDADGAPTEAALGAGAPGGGPVSPQNLAYVIYTSGSTGRPKGVAIEHRSAAALVAWGRTVFPASDLSGVLASTSVCFDLSVFELFLPLATGGRVLLAADGLDLSTLPAAGAVTLVNTVPSVIAELVRMEALPPSVRTVNLAGEALQGDLARRVYAAGTVGRVLNLYGPSEDTTYSTGSVVDPPGRRAAREPDIGRPVAGTRAEILDSHGRPVPLGVAGELHLGGAGLSRGYLGRPGLTADRYVPDPHAGVPGARVYRTGDLARYRPDGRLEFLGRIDHQVKVRGFRIELGEVEATIAAHPAVAACAAVVRGEGAAARLDAVVELRTDLPDTIADLRRFLRERLPTPMVPSAVSVVDELPRTPNGKLDRRALAAWEPPAPGTGGPAAPQGPLERTVARLFCDVLGLPEVGAEDDFFELGGHSLLATRLVFRMTRELGTAVSPRQVFEQRTVRGMAAALSQAPVDHDLPPLVRLPRDGSRLRGLPLSFAQERLWFLDRLDPGGSEYNLPCAMWAQGRLDVRALRAALSEVVRRHESLRTRFVDTEDGPLQVVAPARPLGLPWVDVSALPEERRAGEALRVAATGARRPFDLSAGLLARALLAVTAPESALLAVTMHHVASDGWSLRVLLDELAALYPAFLAGEPPPLPPPAVQYTDFAVWQRGRTSGKRLEAHRAYWRAQLAHLAPLDLPTDRSRSAERRLPAGRVPLSLPPSVCRDVERLAGRRAATPFMVLLAAFYAVLSRYAGQQDFGVGSPIANRTAPETEGLIGLFVNTLVLRADLSGAPSFDELLTRVRATCVDAYAHQDLPFERLVEDLAPDRALDRNPLFDVLFVLQNEAFTAALPGVRLDAADLSAGPAKLDLGVALYPVSDGFGGSIDYRRDLFDAATVDRFRRHFERFVAAAVAAPEDRLSALSMLSPAERHQVLAEWSAAPEFASPPPRAPLERWVAEAARRRPDAIALESEDAAATYGELSRRVRRLAGELRALGVGPEVPVASFVERSIEAVVVLLATLEAGGVCLPLDPSYPDSRLALMAADARPRVVATTRQLAERVRHLFRAPAATAAAAPEILEVAPGAVSAGQPPPGSPGAAPGAGAYVIYTSGSTGRPKGVVVSREAAEVRFRHMAAAFGCSPADRSLGFNTLGFDVAMEEIFTALAAGAPLCLWPPREFSGHDLGRFLRRRRVTLCNLPTAAWVQWLNEAAEAGEGELEDLRLAVVGGEAMPAAAAQRFRETAAARTGLLNGYGPTEAVVTATVHPVGVVPASKDGVPIGRPIGGGRAHVAGPSLEPLAVGVPGELLLGGAALARGYLGDPRRTAERFVPDPFARGGQGEAGGRLYRTGDLARWRPDGSLAFLGRIDRQVKLRGFRVEPGEVEVALAEHPAVQDAVVEVRRGAAGDDRLVAYVVPSQGQPVTPLDLKSHLAERLPPFMVPASYVLLPELPLDPNRKVDRGALPAPDPVSVRRADDLEARTPAEEMVAEAFRQVLGIDAVPLERSFFELGGHSLLASRVASRLRRELDREVPLRLLFEQPTVRGLAASLEGLRGGGAPPLRRMADAAARSTGLPLSFSQERLWFQEQYDRDSVQYSMPGGLWLLGELRVPALARALTTIVARHEALRTRFEEKDGEPRQRVAPPAPVPLPVADLSALPEALRPPAVRELGRREASRPFDLGRPPLLRACLARLSRGEHALVVVMHHIVSDGGSFVVLARELAALYEASVSGRAPELPELAVQFPDFAVWQRASISEEMRRAELAFWRRHLAGVAPLELPSDRPRPPVRSGRGESLAVALPRPVEHALAAFCRESGASPFHVLMAAFQSVLTRWSGQDDFAVGMPVANRARPELEDLVGFFVNTLVLRAQSDPRRGFGEVVRRVRQATVDALSHPDLPLELVVEELVPERSAGRTPLFQVVLGFLNEPPVFHLPGLRVEPLDITSRTAKFDLTLNLHPEGERIVGALELAADLFDRATGRRLWSHVTNLLAAGFAEPTRPVAELHLLARAERHQVTAEWAGGRSAYPRDATLPELVARQVRLRPEAVAVETGSVVLTYGEIARRARRLAAELGRLGVGPDVPVALLLDRSVEMVVATLAVIEAGGCYAPLDPEYPPERLALMLAETGAPVVLAHRHLVSRLADLFGPGVTRLRTVIELDGDAGRRGPPSSIAADAPVAPAPRPESLAYVMYTSGSTGRPKGVAVPHRAVARLVLEADFADLGPEQVFLQLAPTPFDASTLEIWGPLLNGGRLVVMPPGPTDFAELGRGLTARRVSTLWLTAGLFHRMVEEELPALGGLDQLLAGGDVLSPRHVRSVLREHPGVRVINGYGPTENTTFTTCFPIASERAVGTPVPIGRPIADTGVAVLDRQGRPVPVGVPGELHAAGDGLARGYLGRPGATAAAFVPHVRVGEPGARAYRTGDLARWLPDGTLEFLGRLDRQVKLRGFRIELGEVESALADHPGLEEVVVDVQGEGDGEKRLVAYVVASPSATVTPDGLRAHLAGRLPAFMVPAAFVALPSLPLDPNGKVDRRALPAPEVDEAAEVEDHRPLTRAEAAVAGVFAEVLGLDPVPLERSLFDLGGHSLQAARIASRLRREGGWDVPLSLLFERPTVRALAAVLAGQQATAATPLARRVDEEERRAGLPLSFAQERLWLVDRYERGSTQYSIPGGLRLTGELRAPALARALRGIVARHDALRTRFGERGGEARQWVEPAVAVPLPVADLSGLPEPLRDAALRDLGRREAARPFDLGRPPLIRARLARLAPGDHALVVVMHHIVSDGWSMRVLARELAALYRAAETGEPAELPDLAVQYPDYAVWQRETFSETEREQELVAWRERLRGMPDLELPSDRPRPPVRSGRGETIPVALPAPVARGVIASQGESGAGPFHVLMAAFQAVLARWSGQEDFGVGMPVANRTQAETEDLVGFFVNTVVLRARTDPAAGFGELVQRVKAASVEALSHAELPLERIVEALAPARDPSRTPLFQVVLGFVNEPAAFELPGLRVAPFEVASSTAKFDLTLNLHPEGVGLGGAVELSSDLFDRSTGLRLWRHLSTLLSAGLAEPDRPLRDLPLLSPAERHQVVAEWSGRSSGYPREATLPELFARQVRLRPEAVAVESGAGALTYGELGRRARRLAAQLRRRGVGSGSAVALLLERSAEMVVATLAVVEAGGFYAPVDPDYPRDRVELMLEDVAAEVILAHRRLAAHFPDLLDPVEGSMGEAVVLLDEDAAETAGSGEEEPAVGTAAESPAYAMYTSGSTGRPKGVVVPHRAVARLVLEADFAHLGPEETFLQLAPASFDAATLELWGPLLNGGRLVLAPPGRVGLAELRRTLAAGRVTTLWLTAGLFHQVVEERLADLAGVRQLLAGGDVLSPIHVRRVLEGLPGTRVVNGYGPTENTTFTACHVMTSPAEAASPVPIGRPIADTSVVLLDARLSPVAAGVPGELYAAGDGLAQGYLNRPALTAAAFVPHPLARTPGERLYRTGDLARWRGDGTLQFLGRRDHQVKVRGFRIELGEVEAALAAHPTVETAVVVARDDGPGSKRLVAYVVPAPGADPSALAPAALRSHAAERLPGYMVPAAVVALDRLPLDPNGKVDRRALPEPEVAAPAETEASRTPAEAVVADAFARVLGLERVPLGESFFDLGGHSLLATRLASRVGRAFGVELPLRTLFEHPTVRELASVLDELRAGSAPPLAPLPAGSRAAGLPLSFAQERLWFLEQLEGPSARYNVPVVLGLDGDLDRPAFAAALAGVVERHETLRTTFALRDGSPVQVVAPPAAVAVPVVDLAALPGDAAQRALRRLADGEARRPFDLSRGPLLRVVLARLAERSHSAVVNLHHVVSDGWSMGVFLRDLGELYRARRAGELASLPDLPVQYADFAAWQRDWLTGDVLEGQLSYWREALADLPVLELPADRPVPAVRRHAGGAVPVAIGPDLGTRLRELARRHEATPFMVLLAAFQALLSRLSGRDDLAVGTPIANRTRSEVEGLVGFFVNTLVLRAVVAADPPVDELIGRTRERALEAYARQDVPFERLVEELSPGRDLAHSPLFQVLFILQNAPFEAVELPGLELRPEGVATGTAKFDLTLALTDGAGGGFDGSLEYDRELFDATTARRLARSFTVLLAAVADSPDLRLSRLPLVPRQERHQVLVEWSPGALPSATAGTLHEGFVEWAGRSPDAVALVARGETVSYGELDRRSAALAARLRASGIGPDARVGVCLERTPRLLVALLAVLRAGGAYVPLDPAYPRDRIAFMLEDSGCRVVLTESALRERLEAAPAAAEVLELDREAHLAGAGSAPPARPPARPPAQLPDRPPGLAYTIYTSGSTGRPKGVAIEHGSACALLAWARTVFADRELDGVLASTSVCFDLSVFELFLPLTSGGRLLLAADALDLSTLPAAGAVTLVNTVPSAMAELARMGAVPPSVTTVNLAGEPLRAELVRRVYESSRVARVLNLYGPSEDTTYSTFSRVDPADLGEGAEPTIGRPVAGTRAVLLDARGEPVPAGVPGELHLGGAGVSRGYLGRPALTAASYVPDAGGAPGARLYRTGDLARQHADGRLAFLGRIDRQVKLRGFRIELGEVEAALADHPAVEAAAVLVRGEGGDARLTAFVAASEPVAVDDLRGGLHRRLPAYMVPERVVFLEALPLTPNGKVDRRALAARPLDAAPRAAAYAPPRTPVEELLAAAFADVLDVDRVGIHDGFFDLGGQSLKAARLASRLREVLRSEVPLRLLFEHPTVAGLADAVAGLGAGSADSAPPLVPSPRPDGTAPLSHSQERLWILDRIEPGSSAYGMPTAARLRGTVDLPALRRALGRVVARHESLRTTFTTAGGRPVQRIGPARTPALPVVDLRALPAARRKPALDRALGAASARSFDLRNGPLLRALVAWEDEDSRVLHVTTHHIVSDGWSLGVLIEETAVCYRAELAGAPAALPELPVQYADYARWQRRWLTGDTRRIQLDYWRERLAGAPQGLELPLDRPRPAVRSFVGGQSSKRLGPELTSALRRLASRERGTLFMVLLAGFTVLLQRLSGEDDVVLGTPVAGRGRREVEGLIGMFLNTLVLRCDLAGEPSFGELVERVREVALGAYAHQDVPFEMLLDELRPERDLSRTPLFQVFFNMIELPMGDRLELPGAVLEPVRMPDAQSKFDLTLYLQPRDGGVSLEAVYNARLFDAATVDRVLAQYQALLEQAAEDPARAISSFVLPSAGLEAALPDPRERLDRTWHGAVHQALARAAREHPDRVAVCEPGGAWTYATLARECRRVAGWLAAAGVSRGDRVAIYSHRSAALVAAVVGVLESGGAFVILDPAYPPGRLAEMVEVARPAALLVLEAAGEPPPELLASLEGLPRLPIASAPLAAGPSSGPGEETAGADVGPDDPAYVAFTSGSTGRPKGILGRHGSLTHFLPWQCRRFDLRSDERFSVLSGLAHDPLHRDLFTPLWLGATAVVPEPEDFGAAGRLALWLDRERVSAALLTPAMAQVVTERAPGSEEVRAGALRRIFLVGDVLTVRDVERLRRLAPGVTCVNLYGSTETQRAVAFHELEPAASSEAAAGAPAEAGRQVLPLGRGMEDVQLLVLDRSGGLCAVGEVGEVCVRSPHVALGYLDDPALTERKFVSNPFTDDPDDPVYRTGDLGRYLPDGSVAYLGRADDQVKVRGFRIELGEVQAHLAAAPGVREAVVLLEREGPGGRRLVGYVVPEPDALRPTPAELRAFLQGRLPAYMVPAGFAVLDAMPLTPNRKVDRRALARIEDSSREVNMSSGPPETEAEVTIARIVREVLELDTMGVEDNFFELGGNSLLLVQVHGRLEAAFGRTIPMVSLFNHPTVRSLAAHVAPDESRGGAGKEDDERHRLRTDDMKAGRDRLKRRRQRMKT